MKSLLLQQVSLVLVGCKGDDMLGKTGFKVPVFFFFLLFLVIIIYSSVSNLFS